MATNTKDQILDWLGEGYKLRVTNVEASKWSKKQWRTEYLCRKAAAWYYFVYDEPAPNGKRRIVFAYEET
ncbi:MAG: hypothetical protein NXI30_02485 [bacterium]|nr:hypothetical protein [bacterium]